MTKEEIEGLIAIGATRKCNCCNETLPVDEFFVKKDKNNRYYRFNSPCKLCSNLNRNKNYQKDYQRRIKYNLTTEEYEKKMISQKYSCAICGIHRDDCSKDFSVDHCHETGKIRALLCQPCNSGLGFFKESHCILKRATKYIEKYK